MDWVYLIGGFLLLLVCGEALVKGSVGIALKFKISTLVVGMTIVSFGTSAPELLVSVEAALNDHPDISIGNVVGSNIANLALVLGITAFIFPIAVNRNSIRIDWPMMMIASIAFFVFALNYKIEWWEGLIFVTILITFGYWLIRKSRKEGMDAAEEEDLVREARRPMSLNLIFILAGCMGLVYGAHILILGATHIAKDFGVSELAIGLSVVAFGTSLPELVTSAIAAYRKETDLSVGNLIGSCIFNLLGIIGVTALIKEIPVNQASMDWDVYWMLGVSFILLPIMLIFKKFNRVTGLVLCLVYGYYVYSLFSGQLAGS